MKHLEMDLDVETELSSFGLRVNPFQPSPDPKFLWLEGARRETLSNLKSGILKNAGLAVLTGDFGSGKTTLTDTLLRDLGDAVIVVRVSYSSLETLDFLQAIADACGIGGPADSREAFRQRFEQFVDDAGSRDKRVLLVVDEAQSLSRELISEMRHLANVGTDRSTCLNLLLVGENELNAILSEPEDGALEEWIGIRGTTAPLTESEVRQYVQHRLKMAGAGRSLFTAGAIREVSAFSQGIPRLINVIGDLALMSGYRRGANTINAEIVRECAGRLGLPLRNGVKVRSRGAAVPAASAAEEERAGGPRTGVALDDGAGGPSDSPPLRGDGLEAETVTSPAAAVPVASAAEEERAGGPRTGVALDDGAGGPSDSPPLRGDGLEAETVTSPAAAVPVASAADEERAGGPRRGLPWTTAPADRRIRRHFGATVSRPRRSRARQRRTGCERRGGRASRRPSDGGCPGRRRRRTVGFAATSGRRSRGRDGHEPGSGRTGCERRGGRASRRPSDGGCPGRRRRRTVGFAATSGRRSRGRDGHEPGSGRTGCERRGGRASRRPSDGGCPGRRRRRTVGFAATSGRRSRGRDGHEPGSGRTGCERRGRRGSPSPDGGRPGRRRRTVGYAATSGKRSRDGQEPGRGRTGCEP